MYDVTHRCLSGVEGGGKGREKTRRRENEEREERKWEGIFLQVSWIIISVKCFWNKFRIINFEEKYPEMKRENILQKKAFIFAIDCITICRIISKRDNEYIITKQLIRASTSIGANLE